MLHIDWLDGKQFAEWNKENQKNDDYSMRQSNRKIFFLTFWIANWAANFTLVWSKVIYFKWQHWLVSRKQVVVWCNVKNLLISQSVTIFIFVVYRGGGNNKLICSLHLRRGSKNHNYSIFKSNICKYLSVSIKKISITNENSKPDIQLHSLSFNNRTRNTQDIKNRGSGRDIEALWVGCFFIVWLKIMLFFPETRLSHCFFYLFTFVIPSPHTSSINVLLRNVYMYFLLPFTLDWQKKRSLG